jgi:hypothetical protein
MILGIDLSAMVVAVERLKVQRERSLFPGREPCRKVAFRGSACRLLSKFTMDA